jgi:hypothetical protein
MCALQPIHMQRLWRAGFTSMGIWGSKNFESDTTLEHLDIVVTPLHTQISKAF